MNASQTINRMEDAELLTRFVDDCDESAFSQLVQKYQRLVWNVCCRILDNRCDAEDAFQSTFVLLATRAHRIRKPKSLASWLYGVALRTANSVRRQRRRDSIPMSEMADPRSETDILDLIARKNEHELVCTELMSLAEKFKTPLILFYFQGQNATQIGTSLNLSVAAVESRLRRGRSKLRSRLVAQGMNSTSANACFALLPVLGAAQNMNGLLTLQAVNKGIAAATGCGWGSTLTNHLEMLNQTGVRLTMLKTTLAICLTGMLGVGAIVHQDGEPNNDQGIELALVQSEDHANPDFECELEVDTIVVETHENYLEYMHSWLFDLHNHFHHQLFETPVEPEVESVPLIVVDALVDSDALAETLITPENTQFLVRIAENEGGTKEYSVVVAAQNLPIEGQDLAVEYETVVDPDSEKTLRIQLNPLVELIDETDEP